MKPLIPTALILLVVLGACEPRGGEEGPANAASEARSGAPPSVVAREALPETPAGRLVARSIDFHDPEGVWWSRPVRLRWVSSRPGGEQRIARVEIDNRAGSFFLSMELRGHALETSVVGDSARTRVDGIPASEAPAEVRERLRLDREEGRYWRNYFTFLVGLPMKLTDPGAELAAEAPDTVELDGRRALAVPVRFESDDRYPHWELYFAPDDARLVGARFWNEGRGVDGEYITMDGLAEAGPLRLPAERRWYTNAADRHLGTDRVEGLEVGPTR